jgi:hypothetical protein
MSKRARKPSEEGDIVRITIGALIAGATRALIAWLLERIH